MTALLALSTDIDLADEPGSHEIDRLLDAPIRTPQLPVSAMRIDGVRIGTLVGFADDGATPLVVYADQPTPAAQRARTTIDLHGAHIGRPAVLLFEDGDPGLPIVLGCVRQAHENALADTTGHVEVESDGKRLLVSAQDQIVLRCGKASITLTKEGKVILQGAYVSNQSSGVLRLKGGSVQIN